MGPVQHAASAFTPAAIRDQLSRILASDVFNDSPRMARFLRFTVDETLRGNAAQLKETVIGTHVFDRPSGYDPRLDPIVRVEARRLRTKLQSYYQDSGSQDGLIVELPKGCYTPLFRSRAGEATPISEVPEKTATSVAVLPFVDLNPEAGTEFLSDGLTEDLINALTRIPELQIVAWNSVAQLKGQQDELETIRQRLHVTYVIRGSIRQSGDRVRICAYLIDTVKRRYVWSEVYNRTLHDIFEIQEEIAASIQTSLQLKFASVAASPPRLAKVQAIDSYRLCLKGRFHARERTEEGLQRSLACFKQAIAIDREFSAAHAGLADAYTLLAEYGFADGPTSRQRAKAAVQQALALDPNSAEALASLGLILAASDWAWDAAEDVFKRSLALNPGYASTYHWYGLNHLAVLGRFAEARPMLETAIKLDPLTPNVVESRALLYLLLREYDQALAAYEEMLATDPSFYKAYTTMGRIYLHKGMPRRAIELLEKGFALAGEVPTIFGALGQAYGVSGDQANARRMLQRLTQIASSRPVPSTSFALIHLGLGEVDTAFTWLERAVARHESSATGMSNYPAYDALRHESRFGDLLKTMGLGSVTIPADRN
jgi:serine/threonine-protein kinase